MLAVDPSVIGMQPGLRYELGPITKSSHNPLMREDQKWEADWLNTNPSIVYRNGTYHLWYTAKTICPGATPEVCAASGQHCCHPGYNFTVSPTERARGGLLYARSTDGLAWEKPHLGLTEAFNSTANNIVWATDGSGAAQAGVGYDERAGSFLAFGMSFAGHGDQMGTMRSADGLRWTDFVAADSMDVRGDTTNNALWDDALGAYLAFSRIDNKTDEGRMGSRRESRSVSTDFKVWSRGVEVLAGQADWQAYALVPFRLPTSSPGLYFGLGAFFNATEPKYDPPQGGGGTVTCELLLSSDSGASWTRVAPFQAFIPHGAPGSADSHTTYAGSRPFLDPADSRGERLLIYYAGGDGPHSGRRSDSLMLATANASSLAGLAPARTGEVAHVTSAALVATSATLRLHLKPLSPRARVTLRVSAGARLASFELGPANLHAPRWRPIAATAAASVARPALQLESGFVGAEVTLRFSLLDAALFAIEFVY